MNEDLLSMQSKSIAFTLLLPYLALLEASSMPAADKYDLLTKFILEVPA